MYGYNPFGYSSYSSSPLSGFSMSPITSISPITSLSPIISKTSYSRVPSISRTSFYTPYSDLLQSTKALYVPPRPIRMDTADIDVSGPRKIARPISASSSGISTSSAIHRNRSVVRLQSRREKPKKSPGAALVEKFIIKEKKTSPKFSPLVSEEEKREHIFRTKPKDCKIYLEEPNGKETELGIESDVDKLNLDEDRKQRPIKKTIKRPPGFSVKESLNILQESEEENIDENEQKEEKKEEEPIIQTEVVFSFKKKRKSVVENKIEEPVEESFCLTLPPTQCDETDKNDETSNKNDETLTKSDEKRVVTKKKLPVNSNKNERSKNAVKTLETATNVINANLTNANVNDINNTNDKLESKICKVPPDKVDKRDIANESIDKVSACTDEISDKGDNDIGDNAYDSKTNANRNANNFADNNNIKERKVVKNKNKLVDKDSFDKVVDNTPKSKQISNTAGDKKSITNKHCDKIKEQINKDEQQSNSGVGFDKTKEQIVVKDKKEVNASNKVLDKSLEQINTGEGLDQIKEDPGLGKSGKLIKANKVLDKSKEQINTVKNLDTSKEQINTVKNLDKSKEQIKTVKNLDTTKEQINTVKNLDKSKEKISTVKNLDKSKEKISTVKNLDTSKEQINTIKTLDKSKEQINTVKNLDTSKEQIKVNTVLDKSNVKSSLGTDKEQNETKYKEKELLITEDKSRELINNSKGKNKEQMSAAKGTKITEQKVEKTKVSMNDNKSDKELKNELGSDKYKEKLDKNKINIKSAENVITKDTDILTFNVKNNNMGGGGLKLAKDISAGDGPNNSQYDIRDQKLSVLNSPSDTTCDTDSILSGIVDKTDKNNESTSKNNRSKPKSCSNVSITSSNTDQKVDNESKVVNGVKKSGQIGKNDKVKVDGVIDKGKEVVDKKSALNALRLSSVLSQGVISARDDNVESSNDELLVSPLSDEIVPSDVVVNDSGKSDDSSIGDRSDLLTVDESIAKTGEIKRHASKRRPSMVDELEVPVNCERRVSITDEVIVEEAKHLDNMIQIEMAGQRRKSSFGLCKIPDVKKTVKKKTFGIDRSTRKVIKRKTMKAEGNQEVNNNIENDRLRVINDRPSSSKSSDKSTAGLPSLNISPAPEAPVLPPTSLNSGESQNEVPKPLKVPDKSNLKPNDVKSKLTESKSMDQKLLPSSNLSKLPGKLPETKSFDQKSPPASPNISKLTSKFADKFSPKPADIKSSDSNQLDVSNSIPDVGKSDGDKSDKPNDCDIKVEDIPKSDQPISESESETISDEESSSGEDEDSESTESYESTSESSSCDNPGRFTPPATTIPRFRKYTIDDFQFLKVLGKGSFGKVLLAELKGSEYYYAVKCLKKDVVLEDDDVECTMIERKVLALGTGHPYLCHLFCTFQTESHLFFVMEYLNGGDLMFHIQHEGRFDEGRARFYAAEIVSGLKFLHKKGIIYRDLKLDNVLLDYEGHVRIADFGMCKLQIYLDKTADTFCGTPDYMAPEIIKGLKYNQCVDWWSFGILLYEMLVGQSPFSGCDEDDLFWSICNERPHIPKYVSTNAKNILLSLLEKDWTKRLGSSENGVNDVMDHDFFRGLKWYLLDTRRLDPPFKPRMSHPLDTKYFDKAFTSERPRLTPIDKSILASMDQIQFQGFSYTNPNATE